jgi:hypothetical protein
MFKNRIRQCFIKPEHVTKFSEQLAATRFDVETDRLLQKARDLRDRSIAHYLHGEQYRIREEDALTFQDLQPLSAKINSLFDVLTFGARSPKIPLEYHPGVRPPNGPDSRTDIEWLLDSFARESDLINLPETNPVPWAATRHGRSETWLKTFNSWRTKLGLPEA